MPGGARSGAIAPRLADVVVVVFLVLHLSAKVADAAYFSGLGGIPATMALYVLPLLYAIPATRPIWDRYPGPLLAVQAVLTYMPFVLFGRNWVPGMSGLLGGLVLLVLATPRSWIVFGALVVTEGVLWFGVVGLPSIPGASTVTWIQESVVNNGLMLFGLARMAELVARLRHIHARVAELAGAAERLRSAQALSTAIGGRLAAASSHCRAALRALPLDRVGAGTGVSEAAAVARRALAEVRSVTGRTTSGPSASDGRYTIGAVPVVPVAGADEAEPPPAPRIARLVLIALVCCHSVQILANLLVSASGTPSATAATAAVLGMAGLQIYHSTLRQGTRPAWLWTLALQAVLNYALYPVFGSWALGMSGLLAGSGLLLLPRRLAWAGFAVVVGAAALAPPINLSVAVYKLAFVSLTGLAVYGLSRLADLAVELTAANQALAHAAVLRERLRVARDVHDLLGLGLSTVALKSDLVARLIDRDDNRAGAELRELLRICARARSDIRAVTEDSPHLSLRAEIEYAREILISSGIEVRTELAGPQLTAARLPAESDAVLATVLREAVTNVLRHSRAKTCTIQTGVDEDQVRLQVANDGLAHPPAAAGAGTAAGSPGTAPESDGRGGRGLVNLAARTDAAGGRFTAGVADGWFVVTAVVPLPARVRPASMR
jgi:two-component system sensor histidine kinase DesK